ncbi:MAG: beta-N-acetylhexosaminidase [Rubrimonas sp.]
MAAPAPVPTAAGPTASGPSAAIYGCSGLALTKAERAFFADADPFGFILFARNVADPAQLRALTAELRACVGRDAPILIDQEGGRVARLTPPHWRRWADVGTMLAACPPEAAEEALELRYRLIAAELRAVGIDVNCAPVLDVPQQGAHPVIGARALGTDPATVARLGGAVRRGLEAGGVAPVIKHLPGHGRAGADSHEALPVVDAPRAALEADFAAFAPHADAPFGMTAHVLYTALDAEACATLSPVVIGLIRETLGFRGLLMSDDVSMRALAGPMAARCDAALRAGCDVILHCNGLMDEMEAVAGAVGPLAGATLARAEAALAARRPPEPFDAALAEARLRALAAEPVHA